MPFDFMKMAEAISFFGHNLKRKSWMIILHIGYSLSSKNVKDQRWSTCLIETNDDSDENSNQNIWDRWLLLISNEVNFKRSNDHFQGIS